MSKEEYEHRKRLRRIQRRGEEALRRRELKAEIEKYWPKKQWPSTAKIALAYIFISCTAVQIYSMVAMWHFADLSALYSLIGATVGEAISYCAYAAKSAKENTEGGIVHDMAMKGQEGQPEPQDGPCEGSKG